ncbi:MAG TPA: EAL domain-containing protein, partial [Gemmatimonadaceae bacterium]|nr:EAL domain-containing protein [Gemmatimonadaceae bacterium]
QSRLAAQRALTRAVAGAGLSLAAIVFTFVAYSISVGPHTGALPLSWATLGALSAEMLVLTGFVVRIAQRARFQTDAGVEQWHELETRAQELAAANHALSVALDDALVERARTLAAVQASEAHFRSVVESATDAIFTADASGRIIFWNAAAQQVYGYTADEAVGRPLTMLIPEARRESHALEFAELTAGRAPQLTDGPVTRDGLRKNGSSFPVELAISRWEAGGEPFITTIVRDVSARMALEAQLAHQASHDTLTGLANGARFRERVDAALLRWSTQPDRVAVLFLDLDDFKIINDTAGHDVGDRLLAAVGERLLDATRGSDTVARLGGDEFGVLLASTDDPETVAARLVAAMRRPIVLEDREVNITTSVGLARGAPGLDAEDLVRNADIAMYAAKGGSRGGYLWFQPEMNAERVERAQIQAELTPALERSEFRLAYQPIVALDTGLVRGIEALVRWTHPTRGELLPGAFLAFAESSGMIGALGRWVLNEACRTAVKLPGSPSVTVNITGRHLSDPTLSVDVAVALASSGLDPSRLILEITETELMADTESTLPWLRELKAIGVQLAIDDFGTGYSSLRYLQRFPVDILKIDKSFVDRIDHDDHDVALVRTIVTLSDMLGLTTVAEGIERAEQRARVQRLGCVLGQGHYFARPLDPDAIERVLESAAPLPLEGIRTATPPRDQPPVRPRPPAGRRSTRRPAR